MHIIVIGAGTGGMCLAHGLRRAGVSVAVYERDHTRTDNLYGYRVGIDSAGNRALRACLPPELFDTFVATCARAPRFFNVLTEKRGVTASFPLRPDDDPIDSERSVSRMTLRQILLTGMEDVVHFGKEFTRYEQHGDGTVTAHFADGTSATGDLLVAADGTGSAYAASTCRTPGSRSPASWPSPPRCRSPRRPGPCSRPRCSTGSPRCSPLAACSASGTSWSSSGTATAGSSTAWAATSGS
ncbi:FAD-dependent oxidoreductase [Nonomuraea thailandensis]